MMTRMKEKETKPQDYCGAGYIYVELALPNLQDADHLSPV